MEARKKTLLRWVGWFFFVNIVLSILIQATYVSVMPDLTQVYGATTSSLSLAYSFLVVSYIAHATIINLVLAAIVGLCAYFFAYRKFIFSLASFLAMVLIIAQVLDRFAYRLFGSHQIAIGIVILKSGVIKEEMPLSAIEYTVLGAAILAVIVLEAIIGWIVWRYVNRQKTTTKNYGLYVSSVLAACIAVSYVMMAFVVRVPESYRFNDVNSHLLLKVARLVPYYHTVYNWLVPGCDRDTHAWHDGLSHVLVPTGQADRQLHYPLHPLQCQPPKQKPNILFLVFDTLRYDALNPTVMPHVSQFILQTQQFHDVYSGGNCTQPGVFSMFYGMPANYWNATVAQRRGPVMLQQLQQAGYDMKIFASASLLFPEFVKNLFVDIKPLRINSPGSRTVARDKSITKEFDQYLETRDPHKPFFSFLFYDSVHNYCEGSSSVHMTPFKPAIANCKRFSLTAHTDPTPYVNRYHNAAYFLDQEAAQVLATLKRTGALKNTIVVITADHGEQHNDEQMNYWSHASAYTPYQLHIPMYVYWPGMPSKQYNYFASNFDLVPTIMQRVLNCTNALKDYTVGRSLFSKGDRPFLIAGSYTDYAYVTPYQITRIYPDGDYTINNPRGHHTVQTPLDLSLLRQASGQLTRYFK